MLKRMAGLMLLVAALSTTPVFAGFEFHGYGRAGVLLNSEGGQADKGADDGGAVSPNFYGRAPYTHSFGRLGNETDNYLEAALTNTFKAGSVNASTTVMFASKDSHYVTYEQGDDNTKVYVRQLFSEFSNLPFAPKSQIWAGKRFYGRDDICVNDFFVRIMDGTGAGITNLPLGPGNLDLAFIVASETGNNITSDEKKGGLVKKNLNIRYRGVQALGGTWEAELNPSFMTKDKSRNGNDDGLSMTLGYARADFFGLVPGSSKVFFQYGEAIESGLSASNGFAFGKDSSSMRISAFGVADVSENLKVMPSLVYQTVENLYGSDDQDGSWIGFTVRPQYNFTRNLALQAEFGYENMLENKGGAPEGSMMKFTLAPTITLDNTSFWTRPQLRAFVTVGSWDKDLKGFAGGQDVANETSATMYGVQMEAWW